MFFILHASSGFFSCILTKKTQTPTLKVRSSRAFSLMASF
ncbi:hypothetical protein HPHPA8_0644 [Helicobacter pylori Hp A-8]|nr:hypothetical protein HPHPA8_0644 [Helicobacter pylori Hp A-8]